jgi:hypothetical protein
MKFSRMFVLAPAALAMMAMAASADTINTYNFTATTRPYYQLTGCCSYNQVSPSVVIDGTFTFDATDNVMTAWSFDLSPLKGYEEQGSSNTPTTIDAVDVNGSYVLDNTNSYFNSQGSSQAFDFEAYSGDGVYYGNISVNAAVGSDMSFRFANPLPTAGGVTDTLQSYPSGGGYSQCQSCGAVDNYNTYFQSGSAVIATPEPPSWALMGAGALLLGGVMMWSERRRAGWAR